VPGYIALVSLSGLLALSVCFYITR
jgi:hypothetical protein